MKNPEHVLRRSVVIDRPLHDVFEFFSNAGNLARITPPELGFQILTPTPIVMRAGTLIDYRLSLFGLPVAWRTEITRWEPPHQFVDTQLRGPYAQWIHRHSFRSAENGTVVEDEVRYRLPIPLLGLVGYPVIRLQLNRIFNYRTSAIRRYFR